MRAYLFFRKKFWYLFPNLAFRFLVEERREQQLYLSTLTVQEKKEIKKQKWRSWVSFAVSFILHGLFYLGILYNFLSPVLVLEDQALKPSEVDFDIMDGMLASDMDPVYDEESEFIIKPSSLIIYKDKKDQSLANLLERLKGFKSKSLSEMSGKLIRKKKEYKSQIIQEERKLKAGLGWQKSESQVMGKSAAPLRVQLWDRIKMSKSNTTNKNVDYGRIMKVIDQHSFEFQECYEKALLRDENLSGKVIFLLKLAHSQVKTAGLELKGKGSPISRRELTRCLFQESKKLVFSDNKNNVTIKFNLIFGL